VYCCSVTPGVESRRSYRALLRLDIVQPQLTYASRLSLGVQPQNDDLPPYSLPTLRDSDQPFEFDISLYNRPYKLQFYDTKSPENYTLLRPQFVILCYDISSRSSLASLSKTWLPVVNGHYNYDENLPVMVLGLKRDLRKQWKQEEVGENRQGLGASSVMPHEGVQAAQRMLCDLYAECSALTGELCREVLHDVAKTCAKTTTADGAKGGGVLSECAIM
jgi:Ras family protein A